MKRKEYCTMADLRLLAIQVRYQLTLLLRNPRSLMAGLILPGALLALQLGKGGGTDPAVLAARVAGLVVLGAMSIAYLIHASSLVVAREDGVLRRWRATPLPAWGYFTGRIIANALLTLTYLPLIIFSGGFGELSGLPSWLSTLMSYLPAQPMITAVNRALGHSGSLPGRDLAVLAAWALSGLLISVRFFRWDPHRPRHARRARPPGHNGHRQERITAGR